MAAKEQMVREAARRGRIEGVVLRYGAFYGPEAGTIAYLVKMAHRRRLMLPAGGPGVIPWIHVEDAAAATVAAAEGGGSRRDLQRRRRRRGQLRRLLRGAHATARPSDPRSLPPWLVPRFAPYGVLLTAEARIRVSNEKARQGPGVDPDLPTYREGLADVARQLGAA